MSWGRLGAVLIAVQALLVCAYSVWVLGIGVSRTDQVWIVVAIVAVAGAGAWAAVSAWTERVSWPLTAQLPLAAVFAFGTASYAAESGRNVGYLAGSLVLVLALIMLGVHRQLAASIPAIIALVLAVAAVTVPPLDPDPTREECAAPALELFTETQARVSGFEGIENEENLREYAFAAICQPGARERYWYAVALSIAGGAVAHVPRRTRASEPAPS